MTITTATMKATDLQDGPRPYKDHSVEDLFEEEVCALHRAQNLIRLPLELYGEQGGTVQADSVVTLLMAVADGLDTVDNGLRCAVRELRLREADAHTWYACRAHADPPEEKM